MNRSNTGTESSLVESFSHGESCICHDTTDGRNYGTATYMCKSLRKGHSLVKFSSTYSGNPYADVKDIHLGKIKSCKKSLADSQWYRFCGEFDMDSSPALRVDCGGEFKLKY